MNKDRKNVQQGIYLQVLRSTMFLSPNEAASIFRNISVDQWLDFEAGRQQIPEYIIKKFDSLFSWRNKQIVMWRNIISASQTSVLFDFWHSTMDDWMAIDEREPEHFRVSQSITAAMATEFPSRFKIYPFDLSEFTLWAQGRNASEELQAEYLEAVSSRQRINY